MHYSVSKNKNVITNGKYDENKIVFARNIICGLQNELKEYITNGFGPFLAAIYDGNNELIAKCANSVVNENYSNNHAEVNVIKAVEGILGTYDLSKYNLSIYVTSEPCIMCLGAIMWSGIKSVYYGVPSADVEKITGFDEGFKPDWFDEFAKRGITVYGNIEAELGKKILQDYVKSGNIVYRPERRV